VKKKQSFLFNLLAVVSLLIVIALSLAAFSLGTAIYFNSPVQSGKMPPVTEETEGVKKTDDGVYFFDVRKGESSQSAGMRLERTGLIRNRYFWNLLCRLNRDPIKTGTYRIEIPVNMITVHNILVSGKQILHRVTIPEGVTLGKIAAILEESGICFADDFLVSAKDSAVIGSYRIPDSSSSIEGYLFPDTYLFPAEYPPHQVINAMVENFFAKMENIDPSSVNLNPRQLNEKVILASIVEREYRVGEEAPLMAGVFYNRLGINMALQSCATVEYIITEIQGKPHPRVIYNQDLEIRNPYNTYINPGLPPGPICVPGAVALRAAMFPQKTEYLYFRLDDPESGRHYFSRTLDEHIRAGQLFTKRQ
jgi:UPF0755 protein